MNLSLFFVEDGSFCCCCCFLSQRDFTEVLTGVLMLRMLSSSAISFTEVLNEDMVVFNNAGGRYKGEKKDEEKKMKKEKKR